MKNGLLRFYVVFMFVSLALFSCENKDLTQEASNEPTIQRKPEQRHPVEPNDVSGKGKKPHRKFYSPSSNLC